MTQVLPGTVISFYDDAGRTFLSVASYDGSPYNEADPVAGLCNFATPDPEFNLCSLTEYDGFGRVVTTTDAENNVTTYEYDALGNQVAVIDAPSADSRRAHHL